MTWKRAKWRGAVCRTCDEVVWPGQEVGRWGGQWQHRKCVEAQAGVGRVLDELAARRRE